MSRVLRGQFNKFIVVFVDDILVFSKGKEHEDHLREVLEILRRNQKPSFLNATFEKIKSGFLGKLFRNKDWL